MKLYSIRGLSYIVNDITFHQYGFEFSALKANKSAAEYFLQKLSDEEKEASLFRTVKGVVENRDCELYMPTDYFPSDKLSDVFFYLLPLLPSELQMKIIEDNSIDVLLFSLDWPWLDHFSDFVRFVWTFHPEVMYRHLFHFIHTSIRNSDYYFL